MKTLRLKIWRWATRNLTEGETLPSWAIFVRCLLFPIVSLRWILDGNSSGFDFARGLWRIGGVLVSDDAIRMLAQMDGATYRVTRRADYLTFELCEDSSKKTPAHGPGQSALEEVAQRETTG